MVFKQGTSAQLDFKDLVHLTPFVTKMLAIMAVSCVNCHKLSGKLYFKINPFLT